MTENADTQSPDSSDSNQSEGALGGAKPRTSAWPTSDWARAVVDALPPAGNKKKRRRAFDAAHALRP